MNDNHRPTPAAAMIEAARRCIGTPFHHQGRASGIGLDCIGLIVIALRAALREEHQDLDDAGSALEALPMPDQLQVARLKKKKLTLRDQIAKLEDRLTPDIIA